MAIINKVDLFVEQVRGSNNYISVDLDRNVSFSFKYQIGDVINPTAIKNTFTYSVSLPKTKINNNLFANMDRIDYIVANSYNPLIRTNFKLFVNGELYETGYLQLENITKTSYNIRLYGGLGDFFYTLSQTETDNSDEDKRLSSIDFGDFYDHIINRDTLSNYWSSSDNAGLQKDFYDYATKSFITNTPVLNYAMTYQGLYDNFDSASTLDPTGVSVENIWQSDIDGKNSPADTSNPDYQLLYQGNDRNEHQQQEVNRSQGYPQIYSGDYRSYYQKPMLAVRPFLNKIFEIAENEGWTVNLDNTFFNENNPYWSQLWMICTNYSSDASDAVANQINDIDTNLASNDLIDTGVSVPAGIKARVRFDIPIVFRGTRPAGTINNFYQYLNNPGNSHIDAYAIIGGQKYPLYLDNIVYESEAYPDASIYLSNTNQGLAVANATYIGVKNFATITEGQQFYYAKSKDANGNTSDPNTTDGDIFRLTGYYTIDNTNSLLPTAIRIYIAKSELTSPLWQFMGGSSTAIVTTRVMNTQTTIGISNPGLIYITDYEDVIRSNAQISYKNIMKSTATCFDFLTSYSKIFGLYYIKDRTQKTIDIVTRNTYYGNMDKIDWTYQIDYSKEFSVIPVPFDYKVGVFKWNDLETKYEEEYLNKYNKEYGSLRFNTGSEHTDSEYNYLDGILFDNVIITNAKDRYFLSRSTKYNDDKTLPHLEDNSGESVESNFILCFKEGVESVSPNIFYLSDDMNQMEESGYSWGQLNRSEHNQYPSIRRTITQNGNDYSLNFGRPAIDYSGFDTPSNNTEDGAETIYARFWRDYLRDRFSVNCRKLTCWVKLTVSDINNQGLFRKFIYINDTVWVLESIDGFNPLSESPTKVTLIKVQNINNYVSQNYYLPLIINPLIKNVSSNATSYPIEVNSISSWTASTEQDWITITNTSGRPGTGKGAIFILENTTGQERTGYVTYVADGVEVIHTITQEAAIIIPQITIDNPIYRATSLTGTTTIKVYSNVSWNTSFTNSTNYLTVSPISGTNNMPDGQDVTISWNIPSQQLYQQTVNFHQSGSNEVLASLLFTYESTTLTITPQEYTAISEQAFVFSLRVTSNSRWEARVEADPDNVTLQTGSSLEGTQIPGSGNDVITVRVGAVSSPRYFPIYVSTLNSSIVRTCWVQQRDSDIIP